MNFAALFKAFDTVMMLRETAKRLKGNAPASEAPAASPPAGLTGQIEARLTNVVVAALKEAFDRDHARLELERSQLEEQRRRAEEAMRQELRRQAADRELGRLRLLGGMALTGWLGAVVLGVVRLGDASIASRALLAAGWIALLAALGAAFDAQRRVGAAVGHGNQPIEGGRSGEAALWLLVAGLALAAISLLL
ncbi:MAG TPA: hypothetical protein VNI78_07490 [Vicinamibacterales bacterium]|nr:hypothetical protein [Vicinamibacterales bacterium]